MDIQEIRKHIENDPDIVWEKEKEFRKEKALLDDLEDKKKTLLAKLKVSKMGSNVEKQDQAMASDEYSVHLDGIKEQKLIVAQREAEYHYWQNHFEAMRSLNKSI